MIGCTNADSLISTRSPSSETLAGSPSWGSSVTSGSAPSGPDRIRSTRHQVLATARQRADAEQPLRLAVRDRVGPRVRHEPVRGLVPEHAAEEGRDTDRAADVRPEPERRRPAADRRTLAAGRAAGRPRGVVGVAGAPVHAVVGLDPQRQLGDVGEAERDRAGVDQPLDGRRRRLGPVIAPRDEPRAVRHALDRKRLLDRARHPEQRRQLAIVAARDARVGGVSLASRGVETLDGDRAGARLVVARTSRCAPRPPHARRPRLRGSRGREPLPSAG